MKLVDCQIHHLVGALPCGIPASELTRSNASWARNRGGVAVVHAHNTCLSQLQEGAYEVLPVVEVTLKYTEQELSTLATDVNIRAVLDSKAAEDGMVLVGPVLVDRQPVERALPHDLHPINATAPVEPANSSSG